MSFRIEIPAFKYGERIPKKYTCDGENLCPEINWFESPEDTDSFTLIVEDPDAPYKTFTHWIIYNIPRNISKLEESKPLNIRTLDNKAIQANNDFGRSGYGGPCPPKGMDHHYFFRLYALNKYLPEKAYTEVDGKSFHSLIPKNIIVDEAEYMGIYRR